MTAAPTGFDGERHARRLAPAGVLLVAAGVAAGDWYGPAVAVAGLLLLVAAASSATDGVLLIGPFARAELRAAARRGRLWRWRAVFALLCGLVIYLGVFFPRDVARNPAKVPSAAVLTQGVFLGVASALMVYLVHLALTVVAPVVVEERDKKRWEMLLTTDLRNREVLLGKVAGRVPRMLEPLWATLPVLAVLPLLGGMPPALVGVAAAVTVSLVGGFGAVAAYSSVTMPKAEMATAAARGWAIGYLGLSGGLLAAVSYPPLWTFPASVGVTSPVEFRHLVGWLNAGNPAGAAALLFGLGIGRSNSVEDDLVGLARRCVVFWTLVGGTAGLLAVSRLRGERLAGPPVPGTVRGKPKEPADRPPVPDGAVAWWAEYGHLTAPQMAYIGGIGWRRYLRWLVVSLAALGFCRWWAIAHPGVWPDFGHIGKMGGPLVLLAWGAIMLMVPLFMGAQLIARERSADTLSGLTLTALTPRDVVFQKWVGAMRPLRHTVVAGVCWVIAGVATGFLPWWSAAALVLVPPLVPCWAAVGLGFSAHASTPAIAQRNLSGWLLGGGYAVGLLALGVVAAMPSPLLKWVVGGLLGTVAVAAQPVGGWLAFRYAVRRLEREYD